MHISFDFDYTLADSSEGAVICAKYALRSMEKPECSDAEIKKTIGLNLDETYKQLVGYYCDDDLTTFSSLFLRKADEVVVDCIKFYKSTKDSLVELKENGHYISIVSTKYTKRIMEASERDGLVDLIDEVIGGDKVKDSKPSPEGLNMAIRTSKIDKKHTLYVGDSKSDGLAARAAGIGFIAVLTGMTARDDLNRFNPIEVIDDLRELNQAVRSFRSTNEIEQAVASDQDKLG